MITGASADHQTVCSVLPMNSCARKASTRSSMLNEEIFCFCRRLIEPFYTLMSRNACNWDLGYFIFHIINCNFHMPSCLTELLALR